MKLSVVGIRVGVAKAVHKAIKDPAQWGDYTNGSEFWQPIFSSWTRSLATFLFPSTCDGGYISGGTVCEAVDWVLAAGVSPGFGSPTRGDVTHWPLCELAASPSGPDIQAKGLAFQDLLLRVGGQTIFWTEKGYLGFGDFDALAGDVLVVLPGIAIPLLLRPVTGNEWKVVGPCLVKGIMDGEALLLNCKEEDFVLV